MNKWQTLINWGKIQRNTKPSPVDEVKKDNSQIDFEILAAIKEKLSIAEEEVQEK